MRNLWIFAVFLLLVFFAWWVLQDSAIERIATEHERTAAPVPVAVEPKAELIGDQMLKGYGSETQRIEDDLEVLRRLTLSYRLLVKDHSRVPIGCNADLADALRGKNPYQQRFLSDDHPVFSSEGEFQDRWNTPLFLHVQARDRWDWRSAGPDRTLWTADDLELKSSGEFAK